MQAIGVVITSYLSNSHVSTDNNDIESLSNLKLIGKIEVGEKFNVKSLCIENDNLFLAFKRWFYREDRNTVRRFITTTIEKSYNILDSKLLKGETSNQIIIDLILAIRGLKNQGETYSKDRDFCTRIETLIQDIREKLERYRKSHPVLFENLPSVCIEISKSIGLNVGVTERSTHQDVQDVERDQEE